MVCIALLVNFLVVVGATEELLSVQIIFRHGDRTPISTYPNDPYQDEIFLECQPGQLTAQGKRRHYALGQFLRERYYSFLPDEYSAKDIKIMTSDVDRTHMSAASNLAGLYPPTPSQTWESTIAWQPIPIHVNHPVLQPDPSDCLRYDRLIEQRNKGPIIQELDEQYAGLYQYLTENTGENVTTFYDMLLISDTLYIEGLLSYKLPEWTDPVFPSPLHALKAKMYSLDTYNDALKQIVIGPFFDSLIKHFENPIPKFVMYSAHDSVVVNVMNVIDPDYGEFCPEFATVLIFELWKKGTTQYVKAFLKRDTDVVEELEIKNCPAKCKLSKLKSVVSKISITVEDQYRLCQQVS